MALLVGGEKILMGSVMLHATNWYFWNLHGMGVTLTWNAAVLATMVKDHKSNTGTLAEFLKDKTYKLQQDISKPNRKLAIADLEAQDDYFMMDAAEKVALKPGTKKLVRVIKSENKVMLDKIGEISGIGKDKRPGEPSYYQVDFGDQLGIQRYHYLHPSQIVVNDPENYMGQIYCPLCDQTTTGPIFAFKGHENIKYVCLECQGRLEEIEGDGKMILERKIEYFNTKVGLWNLNQLPPVSQCHPGNMY